MADANWATGTLKEVPFWRDGMTPEEYDIERLYLHTHWDDYTKEFYVPLWRQCLAYDGGGKNWAAFCKVFRNMASDLSAENRAFLEAVLENIEPYPEDDPIWDVYGTAKKILEGYL